MLTEILKYRPAERLTRERERELIVSWQQTGDQHALMKLVGAHLWLIGFVMRKVPVGELPRDDLDQEGLIGLIEAAQRFDPSQELRFSTYAFHRVRARLQEYVLRNRSIVRLPLDGEAKGLLFGNPLDRDNDIRLPAADGKPRLAGRRRRTPQGQETLRRRMGLVDRSLNSPVAEGSNEQLIDLVAAPQRAPEAELDRKRASALVRREIRSLPERERYILERRLLDADSAPRSVLGEELGISRERVRQLENRALEQVLTEVSRELGSDLTAHTIVRLFRRLEEQPAENAGMGPGG